VLGRIDVMQMLRTPVAAQSDLIVLQLNSRQLASHGGNVTDSQLRCT
jgi:hypothetical protein